MKTLYREYHAINGTISQAYLMVHPETKELVFCAGFAQHGYDSLRFESLTDIIVFLEGKHNRKYFIISGNEVYYLDGTIYSRYYCTIDEN